MGPQADRLGHRAGQGVAGRPGTGALPVAGRHRRHARRRGHGGGDQLAAGARPLPDPGTDRAQPDGHPQPGDRARRDRGPAGRAGPAVHTGQ